MKFKQVIVGTMLTVGTIGLVTACGTNTQASSSPSQNVTSGGASGQHGPGNWTGRGYGGRGGGMGFMNDAGIAKILGISETTLQSDLKANESLVEVASKKGISEATLIKDMESSFKSQMDTQVQNGKMTSAQEQTMLSRYDSTVKAQVERKGLPQRPTHSGSWGNRTGNAGPGNTTANE